MVSAPFALGMGLVAMVKYEDKWLLQRIYCMPDDTDPRFTSFSVSMATHGMELFTYARVIHDQQQLAHSNLPREGADVPPVSESPPPAAAYTLMNQEKTKHHIVGRLTGQNIFK